MDSMSPLRKPSCDRQSQRGLARRLRVVTGGRGLVIHRENFERRHAKTARRREMRSVLFSPAKSPARPSSALSDARAPSDAKLHRRYRIARGESRMKEHLVAAAIGPLIETARRIRRETKRADRRIFIQPEQPASRDRARQRTGDPGRTKTPDHFLIHDGAADRSANFVTAHRAQDEIPPARLSAAARAPAALERSRRPSGSPRRCACLRAPVHGRAWRSRMPLPLARNAPKFRSRWLGRRQRSPSESPGSPRANRALQKRTTACPTIRS